MRPLRYLVILSSFVTMLAAAQILPVSRSTGSTELSPVSITFQTNPTGLSVIVDGTSHTTPYAADWTTGSVHTINTTSPQLGGTGSRYAFLSWSDGGAQSHSVTAPRRARTYTADFATQYLLTMSASPSEGGTLTPSSGWHNSGQSVAINAAANSGYSFSSWSGTGSGSYSGTTKSTTITMNGPISQTGNFSLVLQPILSISPADRPVSSNSGNTSFTVSNSGTGTMNWTASSDQSWATITSGANGTNTGTISISYTTNPSSTDSRMAAITVAAPGSTGSPKTVSVTQAPAPVPELIVDTRSVSDDFIGATLDARLWTFIDPMGDVTESVTNRELSLAVPGGIKHEPWTSGNSAARILQNVAPSMNVNEWTVQFNSIPAGSNTTIPMEGMLFEQDTLNFVRTDIFSDGSSVYAFAAAFINGPTNPQVFFSVPIPVTSAPVWMRVTREGTHWRVYCSLDGLTSFTAGTFEHLITLNRVGVFAGNSGTSPGAFTCLVEYFQAALPAQPHLDKPDSGASGVTPPVTFTWNAATGATTYRLQVATDSIFATSLIDSMVVGTSSSVSSLQPTLEHYWWKVSGKNDAGWGQSSDSRLFSVSTSDVEQGHALPDRYSLEQNYPNPFNPKTGVRFSVPTQSGRDLVSTRGRDGQVPGVSDVKLTVYDILGREVAVLVNERKSPGTYEVSFDGNGLASGVYVYRMTAGSFVQSRRMVLIK